MNPEIYLRNNTYGIPVGDYIITQITADYGMGSETIYYDISMRRAEAKDLRSYVNMYDSFGTNVFSSSMQKLNMHAFDIENIYVNEEKGTIVVKWGDGVTTKVKLEKGDVFDLEAGVSFALLKRLLISHHHLQRVIKDKVIYSGKEKPDVRRTKSRGSDK